MDTKNISNLITNACSIEYAKVETAPATNNRSITFRFSIDERSNVGEYCIHYVNVVQKHN